MMTTSLFQATPTFVARPAHVETVSLAAGEDASISTGVRTVSTGQEALRTIVFGHAAHQQTPQARATVRAHDDQIGANSPGPPRE